MSIEIEAPRPAGADAVTQQLPVVVAAPDPAPVEAPAPAAPRPKRAGNRLYILDLLRFLAALAVLGYHFIPSSEGSWGPGGDTHVLGATVKAGLQYAYLGVEAFFVISGFVICMSSWGRSLSQFFVSRVTRLMPAYIGAILLTAAVVTLVPAGRDRPHLSHTLINLTMLQRFLHIPSVDSVDWTLFIELKFYMLFSIVVAFGVTYKRVVLFCVFWTIATLFSMYTGSAFLEGLFEPFYAPLFIAGITLYLIHRFGPDLLLWCMLGTSAAIAMTSLAQRDPTKRGITSYPVTVVILLAFLAIMVAVALGWFSWVRWPGLVTLGALTYPVYLLHHRIGLAFIGEFHEHVPFWLLFTTVVAGVLLLSYAVHHLFERPVNKRLRDGLIRSFARIRAADERVIAR
ncbi:acyltransferase family protein [Actinoplanes sp. CA-030573]|uniref:acyltransferase family protein n=1 Tax=Actinoplanes sp. CA-030573 TaxID=3239898 RepID=UPI003D8D8241